MMSRFSTHEAHQVEEVQLKDNQKPGWLDNFLDRTFFDICSIHPIRRNEKNRYCINCQLSACQYCMSAENHRHHKILKIYRHVYKDVVALAAIERHIDCSQIQPFKCNKRLVVSLNPLPHCGPQSNQGVCEICKRRLAEPDHFKYCCISCKATAFARKSNGLVPPFLSIQPSTITSRRKEPKLEKPRQRRKGKPCRAPFF